MQPASRILACRLGIIVLCLLPTTVVAGWIVHRSTGAFATAQKTEWERELTARLGLVVTIERATYPSYSLARLEHVRWLDPETEQPVAAAAALDIFATGAGWRIEAWQPRIEAGQLERIQQAVTERVLRSPAATAARCEFAARDLTILGSQQSLTLADVGCRMEPTTTGPALSGAFRIAGADAASGPLQFSIARDRRSTAPFTRWQLDTAGQALPLGLLAHSQLEHTSLSRLGRDCRFAGSLLLAETAAGLEGELTGTLHDVDLDALVTEQFPHQLSGLATARLDRARIAAGRLIELRGTLHAQHGAISPSLLAAAEEHLQVAMATDNTSIQTGGLAPFRQLAVGFELNERTLSLRGSADPAQDGVLLANAAGPLLIASSEHATPAVNLLRALLPDNQYQVPATRQTDALVRLLPLPDLVPARTASRPAAHTPIRLLPSSPASESRPVQQPKLR